MLGANIRVCQPYVWRYLIQWPLIISLIVFLEHHCSLESVHANIRQCIHASMPGAWSEFELQFHLSIWLYLNTIVLLLFQAIYNFTNSILLFDWQCLYTASWWHKLNVICRSKNLDQHHLQTPQFFNSWIKQLGSMGTRIGLGATIQLSLTALSYLVSQNFIVRFQHHIQTSLNSS